MDLAQLTQFFAWCLAINVGLLIFSSIALIALRGPVTQLHSRLTGVPEADLPRLYFQFLANYKIAVIVFSLVPYFALRIMG
jgi:hypothetical protein